VAEAVEGGGLEEVVGEVEGEGRAVGAELVHEGGSVHRGNKADHFLDLVTGQHRFSPHPWIYNSRHM